MNKLLAQKGPVKLGSKTEMIIENLAVKHVDSYLDFIKAGLNINMIVGIDFTIGNGLKEDSDSLH